MERVRPSLVSAPAPTVCAPVSRAPTALTAERRVNADGSSADVGAMAAAKPSIKDALQRKLIAVFPDMTEFVLPLHLHIRYVCC